MNHIKWSKIPQHGLSCQKQAQDDNNSWNTKMITDKIPITKIKLNLRWDEMQWYAC